jgi:2'-5' RNA ligase
MKPFVRVAKKKYFKIGIVGYSAVYFDKKKAKEILEKLIDKAIKKNTEKLPISIVSGLTDLGIPALAYKIATERSYQTVGYACKQAKQFDCFNVDQENIIGKEWGDESEEFLNNIDVIIRVGGGKQSLAEVKQAKEKEISVYEEDLPKKRACCLMGFLDSESAKRLHKQAKSTKAEDVKKEDSYHITIRYWLIDIEDSKHLTKIKKFLDERFEYPVQIEVDFDGKIDVFGLEKSYVLHVESSILTTFQTEMDKALQDLGAPPSDYPTYKPHITIAEGVTKKPKLEKSKFLINNWKLTTGDNPNNRSETIWEKDFPLKKAATTKKVVTSEADFVNILTKAKNIDDVLDYLIHKTPERVRKEVVFDHFLLVFFSVLPNFHERQDFEEEELENFKEKFPYEEIGIKREEALLKIKNYRSLNRILEELVEMIPASIILELARDHLKTFWFKEKCQGDLKKFVSMLRPNYWMRQA